MQITKHIVQSPEWAEFKNAYGTRTVRCGEIYYSKHHIPFTPFFVAYCPRVNPFLIDWKELEESLKKEGCVVVNFDVPNVIRGIEKSEEADEVLKSKCIKSHKETFAASTILLDLTKTEDDLFKNMHLKHRYNIRLAQKNGVIVDKAKDLTDFEVFYELFKSTSLRQKYYVHPKTYYQKIWETLFPKGMCHILTAKHNGKALASWMLFSYQNVLYYPYGGSSDKMHNLFPSNLLGWEVMKFGKELGCHTFDMWGAARNPNDKSNAWWGFTNFKLKFGGELVECIDSYDFVTNPVVYEVFNLANNLRWKILKSIR